MRLGYAGPTDAGEQLAAAGFDFLEARAEDVLRPDEEDADWEADLDRLTSLPLPIETAGALLPAALPIVGKRRRDTAALGLHLRREAERAGRLGVSCLIFGSGAARRRPEKTDEAAAFQQLVHFCQLAGELCREHGVILAVAPLPSDRTNMINDLGEVRDLVEQVSHPAVAALAGAEGIEGPEAEATVRALGGHLRHVHLPWSVVDSPQAHDRLQRVFAVLQAAGYDDRVSIVGSDTPPTGEAVQRVREAWQAAEG